MNTYATANAPLSLLPKDHRWVGELAIAQGWRLGQRGKHPALFPPPDRLQSHPKTGYPIEFVTMTKSPGDRMTIERLKIVLRYAGLDIPNQRRKRK